ncbi:MAG: BTAD domain-containing putative transcriptional regulator [Solirubrobacteraceae bacterium]
MEFAVLGPVLVDGRPPRGAIERALLTRLLVAPGAPVAAVELVEAAWPPERRARAAGSLQVRLAKLRALLEPDRVAGTPAEVLVRDPAGYRLVVAPESVDAGRFTRLADAAARLPAQGALGRCEEALALWRGEPFAELDHLRHPELVRSLVLVSTYARPDALFRSQLNFWRWLPEVAPSERASFEAFFTWVYTPRAHADGSVDQIVEDALAFPHQQSAEAFQAQVDVCLAHDTADRLSEIAAPTLVLAGEFDTILPSRFGRSVAAGIPNARFDVMAGEAHQPFQETPDEFNARVDAFWREVDARV